MLTDSMVGILAQDIHMSNHRSVLFNITNLTSQLRLNDAKKKKCNFLALHFLVAMLSDSRFLPRLNTGSPCVMLAHYRTLASLTQHRLGKSVYAGGLYSSILEASCHGIKTLGLDH